MTLSRTRKLTITFAWWILIFFQSVAAQPVIDGFTTQVIHGFPVLINDADVAAQPSAMQTAVTELTSQLSMIAALPISANVMEKIREVKIFLVFNTRSDGAAWYHPSEQWLIDNGRNPAKALSVEIANAVHFVNWSRQNQPYMVLHELTHGYHHQTLGYDHAATLAAFASARDSGIYESVPYNPGAGQPRFNQRAYALNNEIEYLAEITEAFFGMNDYYPFNRTDLETFDPLGYALLLDIWEVSNSTAVEEHPSELALSLYPNPVYDELQIETATAGQVSVFDLTGRVVAEKRVGPGQSSLDLSSLPPGLFVVRIESGNNVTTKQIVRVR